MNGTFSRMSLHRTVFCGLVAAFIVSQAPPALAQFMTHEWVVSLGGGLSDPTGEFEQQVEMGGHVTAEVGHYFNPSWMLGVRGGYYAFAAEDSWRAISGMDRIRYWSLEVENRLMLYPESRFTPYIAGGLGANLETVWYVDPAGERAVDVFRVSFTGGVGFSYHRQSSPLTVFSELIYHHFPTPDGSRQFLRWTSGLRISMGGRPF